MPEKNLLLDLPKVEITKADKIATKITSNASKRSEKLEFEGAARNTVINASMYDKKIEKLQSYGSKWNNYGYNPNGNSEAFYDKMTSDTEQWGRSIHGAAKLAGIGFNDSVLFGAFANGKENANNFAQVADMYGTQRGGVTGFVQNLTLNAGYTMGIMADMALEEAAIAGISALAALPSGGASVIAGGAGMIAKGVKAFGLIGKSFDKMNDLKRAINAADKINDVSKIAKIGNKVGNFINPLEHSVKYIKALKNVSSVKDLSSLGKVAQGGAALFRDVKAMQMAYSEAKLEANMLEKDMHDAYRRENPYMTEEEGNDLSKRVADAKQYTTWENAGAIFATNKLVFNNMYKRFDDIKGVGKFFSTGSFGKLAAGAEGTAVIRSGNMLQKGFYQGIKDQGKLLFEKGIGNGLGKIGKTVISKSGKYGISNLGEGLQETIQETIQAKNKYQFGSSASGGYYDSVIHGLKEQKSAQGFETFLSGFLMGGLVSPITSVFTAPINFAKSGAYKQFTNKEKFNTEREKKLESLKLDSDLINEGFKNVGHVYNSMGNSLATQARIEKEMMTAVAEGDRHIFQDKKDESFRTHLHTMMKHGMLDEFVKHTKGFKNMDSKQAALAFGIDENTKPEVVEKLISKKVEQAERFKNRYTKFKADYQSPVNISKLDMADPAAMEIINYHHNWNKAVDDMIFDTAEFEQNLDRKKDLLGVIQKDAEAAGVAYHDYNALTSDKEMNKEIGLLTQEISVLEGYDSLTPEAKKDLTKKSHKLKALVRYQESLGEHSRVIQKIDELQSKETNTKAEKELLKKLNKQVKRAADTMELRHGQYLEVVHSGEYDSSNTTVNEVSRNSRINRFSKGSFALLYDYYKLDSRNKSLETSLDILSDPEYLKNYVERTNKMSAQVIEQHKEYIKNSIAKFRDQEHVNKVVKELLDAGVSFDLSELDALIQKGIMPKQFFDIATEQVLKQSDPKYKEALKKLNALVDDLIEQPILEKENDIYREVGRGVRINEADKRTYNQIAKEYGFDVANEQKVSDVLDTIIASKSSTKGEKELAKLLKNLVDKNAKVSFVDNSSRPNKFKDGVSIIDGRYASSNFTNSFFSIEELILKNELERLTTDALKNDSIFYAEVESLQQTVIDFVKSENEKNKDDEAKQIRDDWKAFDSPLDFIKESFGNQSFQALLARVQAPKKETTVWESLIDSLADALTKLMGKSVNVSSSVYNSIVSVVQAKIDPSQLNAPEQDDSLVEEDEEAPEVTPETVDVVEDLPVLEEESFDPNAELSAYPKALLNQLIDGYKQAIKDGDAIADVKINELSDTNITPNFKSWVDDNGAQIITAYDAAVNEPMPANSEILDDENKSILAGKGYTAEQINAMTPAQVEKALTENVTIDTETSLEEQVVDELIDENINIVNNEETSEEEIPTDTTGEGTGDTVGNETNQKENPKQPEESLRNNEEALREIFFGKTFESGIYSPKVVLEDIAKKELVKEALANKKLFRKVVAPTKEEITKRAFEMYLNNIKNTTQDNSVFLWNVYDGKGGFDSKYKSEGNSIGLNTVDVRNNPKLHTYTFNETFNDDGIRFVDIKIPIQETDSSGSNRPPIFTSILIALPDGMSAAQVAEPLLAKAKEISANRTSYKNPTTTKEMFDALIPIAEGIIKNTKNESQTQKISSTPKSIGANTDVVVVDDQKESKVFDEWTDPEVKDPRTTSKLVIAKKIQEIYDFGQELDNSNAEWSIGSFRAQVDGRLMVDVFANGKRFLMYKSIGEGTGIESKDEWVPIFGFSESGWFIKDNWKGKNPKFTKYESKTYMAIAQYLKSSSVEDALFSGPKTTPTTSTETDVTDNPIKSKEDLKINVSATTLNGNEDLYKQDYELKEVDENKVTRATKTTTNSDNISGYYIEDGILRIRVQGADRHGRGGGGTIVSLKLPSNFNEKSFAEKLKNISHKGGVTTDKAIQQVVTDVKTAIFDSIEKPKVEDTTSKVKPIPEQITKAFEDLAKSVGEASAKKMQEYADRIKAGEAKEKVLEGLGKSFIDGVNALLGDAALSESSIEAKRVADVERINKEWEEELNAKDKQSGVLKRNMDKDVLEKRRIIQEFIDTNGEVDSIEGWDDLRGDIQALLFEGKFDEAKAKVPQTYEDKINEKYKALLAALEGTAVNITVPKLSTVKIDLESLSIDELKNVVTQLKQKEVNARANAKAGKQVLITDAQYKDDREAVKNYVAALEAQTSNTKTARDLALESIKFVAGDMDYYETTVTSSKFASRKSAEDYVNEHFDKLEKTSEVPVGKNASMHQQLVDKLTSGKSVKAKLTGKTPNSNTGFVMEVDGKKVIIYDHDVAIKAEDFGKPVTLKLIPVLKRPGIEDLKNVIQVYSGDRFLGNVALTDYDTTAKTTLDENSTDEEIRNVSEDVVDNNEEVFATDESKMIALGYTPTDIKKLSKAVKMHIIKNGITKQQFVAEQKALDKLKVENQIQSDITNFLKDKFTGVKTEEALVKVYDELIKHATSKMKVTLEEINAIHLPFIKNIFNQAKIDLANQKDFSTLSVGDKLLLTDGRIVKVAKVNKTSVDVVDFNSIIENKAKLTSKQFNTDVKKVINDFNLKQDEIVSALDQNNLDDLSSILSKFTTQSFAITDEEVKDEDILEHFKACK